VDDTIKGRILPVGHVATLVPKADSGNSAVQAQLYFSYSAIQLYKGVSGVIGVF
jgi:hypothetical protein